MVLGLEIAGFVLGIFLLIKSTIKLNKYVKKFKIKGFKKFMNYFFLYIISLFIGVVLSIVIFIDPFKAGQMSWFFQGFISQLVLKWIIWYQKSKLGIEEAYSEN